MCEDIAEQAKDAEEELHDGNLSACSTFECRRAEWDRHIAALTSIRNEYVKCITDTYGTAVYHANGCPSA